MWYLLLRLLWMECQHPSCLTGLHNNIALLGSEFAYVRYQTQNLYALFRREEWRLEQSLSMTTIDLHGLVRESGAVNEVETGNVAVHGR